jgi:hypothetical protein
VSDPAAKEPCKCLMSEPGLCILEVCYCTVHHGPLPPQGTKGRSEGPSEEPWGHTTFDGRPITKGEKRMLRAIFGPRQEKADMLREVSDLRAKLADLQELVYLVSVALSGELGPTQDGSAPIVQNALRLRAKLAEAEKDRDDWKNQAREIGLSNAEHIRWQREEREKREKLVEAVLDYRGAHVCPRRPPNVKSRGCGESHRRLDAALAPFQPTEAK